MALCRSEIPKLVTLLRKKLLRNTSVVVVVAHLVLALEVRHLDFQLVNFKLQRSQTSGVRCDCVHAGFQFFIPAVKSGEAGLEVVRGSCRK